MTTDVVIEIRSGSTVLRRFARKAGVSIWHSLTTISERLGWRSLATAPARKESPDRKWVA